MHNTLAGATYSFTSGLRCHWNHCRFRDGKAINWITKVFSMHYLRLRESVHRYIGSECARVHVQLLQISLNYLLAGTGPLLEDLLSIWSTADGGMWHFTSVLCKRRTPVELELQQSLLGVQSPTPTSNKMTSTLSVNHLTQTDPKRNTTTNTNPVPNPNTNPRDLCNNRKVGQEI